MKALTALSALLAFPGCTLLGAHKVPCFGDDDCPPAVPRCVEGLCGDEAALCALAPVAGGEGTCASPFVLVGGPEDGDNSAASSQETGSCLDSHVDVWRYDACAPATLTVTLAAPSLAAIGGFARADSCTGEEVACTQRAGTNPAAAPFLVDVVMGDRLLFFVGSQDDAGGAYTIGASTYPPRCGDGLLSPASEACDYGPNGGLVCTDRCAFVTDGVTGEGAQNDEGRHQIGRRHEINDFGPLAQAGALAFSSSALIHGAISPAGDEDAFRLDNVSAAPVTFEVRTLGLTTDCARHAGFDTDTELFLLRDDHLLPDEHNDDGTNGPCSSLTVPVDVGHHTFIIVGKFGDDGVLADYFLQIELI